MNNDLPGIPSDQSRKPDGIEHAFNAASGIQYRSRYLRLSKTLTYSYLFVLPLIVLYEIGIRLVNAGSASQIRISADVIIKRVLALIGLHDTLLLAGLLIIVGGVVYVIERRSDLPIIPRYFAFMLGESALYAVALGIMIATFVSQLFSLQIPPQVVTGEPPDVIRNLVLSLGAGIYEELLFRLILVSGLYAVLRAIKLDDRIVYPIAAVVGALIFSWVHYVGALGDPFTLSSFTFRFLMGLALNALFLLRGFGIAAMTHALYDVFVTVT